ncbi:permease prefix domain 1-containing protein [Clostridium sp.]|uniref:permease prefix domain 1-containing protein n=1 Tax=Clostridium sp. TaxID=1506 RepID=UPI0039F59A86
MKERIKKYVDNLFADIYDTKQLRELKEEISANLLEKINDLRASGMKEDEAFNEAVSSLGNMDELVENLKKASNEKFEDDIFNTTPLDKKHIIAYIVAAVALLFGVMSAGIVYLQDKNMMATLGTLMPFTMVSILLFMYFGLTQETKYSYGMRPRRALLYCLATESIVFGGFSTGFVYFSGQELFSVLATSMPFLIISVVLFIYLGLTEKNRRKMNEAWQKQWIQYYSDPQSMMVRGNVSGAIWIFSFAAFLLIGFTIGWKFSWIVFIVAIGFEVLIESFFMTKRR